jgi:hypothetical protein
MIKALRRRIKNAKIKRHAYDPNKDKLIKRAEHICTISALAEQCSSSDEEIIHF